jgi:hypothetical protein
MSADVWEEHIISIFRNEKQAKPINQSEASKEAAHICCKFHTDFYLSLYFDSEDESNKFVRNIARL